jgi:uncharacterized protein (TIGR02001 family)
MRRRLANFFEESALMTKPLAVFCGAAAFAAPAAVAACDASGSATLAFESRYVFRGVELSEASFQPTVSAACGSFYGSIWSNIPVENDNASSRIAEEIDLVAGYSTNVGGPFTIDVGVTYYVYPDRASGFFDAFSEDGDGLGANSVEPYVGVTIAAPGTPKLYVYRDVHFDTTTAQASASHSVPIAEKMSLALAATLGYVFDDQGGTDFLYGQASATVNFNVTDKAVIYAGGRFGGSDIPGGGIFDEPSLGSRKSADAWFGLGVSASF